MPSDIVKFASKYSTPCKKLNIAPKIIVRLKLNNAAYLFPNTIALCAQVQVAPDNNRITVFKRGTSQGFNTSIPGGGQIPPISKDGERLAAKNAQKKAKKNIASDAINKSIPDLNPD